MAFLNFNNVRIVGIAANVPKNIVRNVGNNVQSKDYDAAAFVETTGVEERRISNCLTTSDLCYAAAEKLIADLQWDKSSIDSIVFVSQTTDYFLPATACILQARLGLSKDCYAEDIVLGCSGWVYGLSTVVSLISNGGIKRALLLTGDAKRHVETFDPLFGFAGTATALEYNDSCGDIMFHFGTDGSGFDAIIIPDGGSRNQITTSSFLQEDVDGKQYNRLQTRMKGMDVFSFGISTAPKSVKKLAEHFEFDYSDYDYFIFHQANLKMNELIRKKLNLEPEKVPYSMPKFGNTSSASIPLTIVSQLKCKIEQFPTKFICCGFGVGLSWGTVAFITENIVVSELVEVEDNQIDNKYVV